MVFTDCPPGPEEQYVSFRISDNFNTISNSSASGTITTNNVNLSINIDKTGNAQVDTQEQDSKSGGQDTEHQEAEKSKQFADAIRSAVQKEITKQQRPGGLLRDGATYAAGRRV